MSHLDIRHTVRGEITSSDAELLDKIVSNLPSPSSPLVGVDYDLTRTDAGNAGERVVGRMSFSPDGAEFTYDADGTLLAVVDSDAGEGEVLRDDVSSTDIFTSGDAAMELFNTITSHDLASQADNWVVQVYKSPQGGTTQTELRSYFEENPSEQLTTDDGVQYVPDGWDYRNHIIAEDSG